MLYAACFIFFVISLLLSIKIILMKKSLAEISAGFSRSMSQDTNVVVSVSSRDKAVLDLACNINDSLLKLKNHSCASSAEMKNSKQSYPVYPTTCALPDSHTRISRYAGKKPQYKFMLQQIRIQIPARDKKQN